MFQRIPEPELMESADQVAAYADADFSESHNHIIEQIATTFPDSRFNGDVLNLGCGSGDDTFRFLNQFPDSRVIGIDGSAAMIGRAKFELIAHHKALADRAEFVVGYIPSEDIPRRPYVAILSNSLLHHMHKPDLFWSAVKEYSSMGTAIFVADLRRPSSAEDAKELVRHYAEDAPEILRADFYNSLCAAFTADEVRGQLNVAGLTELKVREIGDRHLVISGVRG
jgi:trans-aconitate methyltransferase